MDHDTSRHDQPGTGGLADRVPGGGKDSPPMAYGDFTGVTDPSVSAPTLLAEQTDDDPGTVGEPKSHLWWWVAATAAGLILTAVLTLSLISKKEVAFRPGSAIPADESLEIEGAEFYEPTGDIFFLTVTVDRLSVLEWLFARSDDDVDIFDEREVFGDKSPKENTRQNAVLMTRSKSNAELAALSYLGYRVFDPPTAALISTVADGTPAAEAKLLAGESIVGIDGQSVRSRADALQALEQHAPRPDGKDRPRSGRRCHPFGDRNARARGLMDKAKDSSVSV